MLHLLFVNDTFASVAGRRSGELDEERLGARAPEARARLLHRRERAVRLVCGHVDPVVGRERDRKRRDRQQRPEHRCADQHLSPVPPNCRRRPPTPICPLPTCAAAAATPEVGRHGARRRHRQHRHVISARPLSKWLRAATALRSPTSLRPRRTRVVTHLVHKARERRVPRIRRLSAAAAVCFGVGGQFEGGARSRCVDRFGSAHTPLSASVRTTAQASGIRGRGGVLLTIARLGLVPHCAGSPANWSCVVNACVSSRATLRTEYAKSSL